jgi:hypothetical protein
MSSGSWLNWLTSRPSAQRPLARRRRPCILLLEQLDERLLPSSAPAVVTNPVDVTVDLDPKTKTAMVTFTAAATGDPKPKVQWFESSDGVHFTRIYSATSPTLRYAATSADNGDKIEAVFTNGVGNPATTKTANLTVHFGPVITTQPASQTVVATGGQINLTAAANANPAASVQWQSSTDRGKTWTNVANATSATLKATALTTTGLEEFRAVFSNTVAGKTLTATTRPALVTVDAPPVVTKNPTSVNASGKDGQQVRVTFTAAATGTPGPTVQWQVSTDNGKTFQDLVNAKSSSLTFVTKISKTNNLNNNQYRAVFKNPAAPGGVATSPATLTITVLP